MNKRKTKELQNQAQIEMYQKKGPAQLGPWTSHMWRSDPKHLLFVLARYKFCSKMLVGKKDVLEIGCGDAFGIPVILESVESVHAIDFEPLVIEDATSRLKIEGVRGCKFSVLDITKQPLGKKFDAAYSLDVIEHIPSELEDHFMANICHSLQSHGICIIGTPNIDAKKYSSEYSAAGHVNLKSEENLRDILSCYFHNVFIFSMNDEIVHTGFYHMAHYLFGVGISVKQL